MRTIVWVPSSWRVRLSDVVACALQLFLRGSRSACPLVFRMRVLICSPRAIADPFNDGPPWARVELVNLIGGGAALIDPKALGSRLVMWSGWVSDPETEGPEPEPEQVPRSPRSWAGEAWRTFLETSRELAGRCAAQGVQLIIRPHARHALADAQRCLTMLRAESPGLGVLLDPVAMLEPGMLGHVEDHLARVLESLGGHPGVAGVMVTSAEVHKRDGEPSLRAAPLTRGVIPTAVLLDVVRRCVPDDLPRVIVSDDIDAQMRLLRS